MIASSTETSEKTGKSLLGIEVGILMDRYACSHAKVRRG